MPDWKLPLTGVALALAIGLAAAAPAAAAPAVPPSGIAKADAGSMVTQVRRYRHFHHHHRGRWGRGVGVGIGLGIIGGIIASEAYRSAPAYADDEVYDAPPPGYGGDPRELCARNFRSFEWNTGLYTTYGGDKKLCPYLR